MTTDGDASGFRRRTNQAYCEEKFACAPLLKLRLSRALRIGLRVLLFLLL
jgi:hypothetical protein